jgi:concanavalin A-like lectin/glucanase superfamily protein/type IX secretion system substrate protein
MKKSHYFFLALMLFAFSTSIFSDPSYYNYNNGTVDNSFPFGITTGKMIQTLIGPGEFNTPTPAPNGNITSFSFRISATYPIPNVTYTNFRILFLDTNLTTLPTALVNGNWDTVYYRASILFNAPVNTWLDVVLDHPHAYNSTRSLLVQIEQCAGAGATGFPLRHTNTPGFNRRTYSSAGCPFTYGGTSTYVSNVGINVTQPPSGPDYLYYKCENNPSGTTILNCAVPGVGTPTATFSALTFTSGGQFDTCLTGTGAASGGITTGWNCNLGTSSWTISMWLSIPTETGGLAYYIFGDVGSASFRCFHNGVALPNNLVMRGGFTDVTVTGTGPNPTVVTFVYDSAAGNVKAYKNGTIAVTSTQILNITTGTGFKVGGYSTSPTFLGKLDEFRLYHRALSAAEVLATYNSDLAGCGIVGINNNNTQIPNTYALNQNYPNPFNPVTTINFSIPKAGLTKLIIYDMLGREVKTLVNSDLTAGDYDIKFSSYNIASGTYFYTLTSGNFTATKKMVIIK